MTAKACIVVIEDERHMREMLELGLAREGYDVTSARDASAALRLIREVRFDAIVLDVMLPHASGIELIPQIRTYSQAPILMLTARADKPTKLRALAEGADDYIVKPFDFDELLVRLEAAMRRPSLRRPPVRRYHDLSVDCDRRVVTRGERGIDLTQREFDLLAVLAEAPETVFRKATLIDRVWGAEYDGSPGVLDTYVSYLREKLEADDASRMIQTVRGVGFVLRSDSRRA